MSQVKRFSPLQFHFAKHWRHEIRPLFAEGETAEALAGVQLHYMELANFQYDETKDDDPDYAREVYELEIHKAAVLTKDLFWLKRTFESSNLAPLSLAIARALFPVGAWDYVETDFHTVIANDDHTIVFDMKYYDRLSGEASLFLAGAQDSISTSAMTEAQDFIQAKHARDYENIERLQRDLQRFSQNAEVVPLRPSREP